MGKEKQRSIDEDSQEMLRIAEQEGIETAWDRFEKQQPQCGYGQLGICCRNCMMGPCRIDPFGGEPKRGVCGATADTIVARNLIRMIAGGASAHSDHGRHVAITMHEALEGKAPYRITDEKKLNAVATKLGIDTKGKDKTEIGKEVIAKVFEDFGKQDEEPLNFVKGYVNEKR